MEKIMSMTLQELIDDGARIDISFHWNRDIKEAQEKIEKYEGLGNVEQRTNNVDTHWLKIDGDDVYVAAFYEHEEEHSTEHAQALLTERERKHREAGVKESDFR